MIFAHIVLKAHVHPEQILGIGSVALIAWGLLKLSNWVEKRRAN